MKINFDTLIADAFGRTVLEPELTPTGVPVTTPVKDEAGEPVMVPGPDGRLVVQREHVLNPVTLKQVCVSALTRKWPDEQLTETMTFDRFMLAMRLAAGGEVELTLEERSKIQAATDNWRTSAPVYMARARLLLDAQASASA